jgi:tetratricopeptide (TPR) repeat protein
MTRSMQRYSTRQVSTFIGISKWTVYALVRAGILNPSRGARGHFVFSFRDLVILRTARNLLGSALSPRRLAQTFRSLRRQLPRETPLSALRILVDGDQVLVSERSGTWEPDSGQMLLNFSLHEIRQSLAPGRRLQPLNVERALTATESFERALELDDLGQANEAEVFYRRTLALDPRHAPALINLGRLLHTAGKLEEAEARYRAALEVNAAHGVAHFNLGVVLEDRGCLPVAIECYQAACATQPAVPDAHFNLARLYRSRGDLASAAHHLECFRRLRSTLPD